MVDGSSSMIVKPTDFGVHNEKETGSGDNVQGCPTVTRLEGCGCGDAEQGCSMATCTEGELEVEEGSTSSRQHRTQDVRVVHDVVGRLCRVVSG